MSVSASAISAIYINPRFHRRISDNIIPLFFEASPFSSASSICRVSHSKFAGFPLETIERVVNAACT
jgi:hypothetical protein